VITTDTPLLREITGDDALYCDPADSESIASRMMHIYKDESFRNMLIEKGKVTATKYSFDQSAKLFWQGISGIKADLKTHGMD
jgi:glycosyltransferase involved in cell wall biosynthesis